MGRKLAGFPVLLQVVWGGVVAEVSDAVVLGKWISRGVGDGKPQKPNKMGTN
jgi:hypothetical protein